MVPKSEQILNTMTKYDQNNNNDRNNTSDPCLCGLSLPLGPNYIAPNMCVSIETKHPPARDQALDDDANNDKDNSIEKDNSMEKSHPNVINIDKAIMVSDLHLGYENCNVTAFTDFLDNCIANGISKQYSLFILGYLWDLCSLQSFCLCSELMPEGVAFNIIKSWLDRCNSVSRLDINPRQKIDEAFNKVGNYRPVSRDKLKEENNSLYVRLKADGVIE
jgi:hypothetical protein